MPRVKPENDPTTPSMNYKVMEPRWKMIDTLLGGTEAMREAGEEFLPPHPRESDLNYQERLSKAVLHNMFELTVNLLADKPFTEAVTLTEEAPEVLSTYVNDIDLRGSDITRFSYEVFRSGLAKGFTHILVDAPRSDIPTGARTLADDREEGMRPYLVHIRPEDLIFAETVRIGGEEIYRHVRFNHWEKTRVGFAETFKHYVRVLNLVFEPDGTKFVMSEWYHKVEEGRNKGEWAVDPDRGGIIDIDRIPLVTFYTDRDDTLLGKPALLDLAFQNVEHWQSYSDQQNILTVTRFPLLASSGISEYDGNDTTVGPRNMLVAEDPQARFYYVEHNGAAINAGEKSLADLENKMASYGGSLLQRRPDRETAEARASAEATFTSPLQRMVLAFQDIMANALSILLQMDGESGVDGQTLSSMLNVKSNFSDDSADAVDMQTLQVAIREGAISRRGFLSSLVRLKVLPEDFDIDAEMENIKDEAGLIAILSAAKKGLSDVEDPSAQNNDPQGNGSPQGQQPGPDLRERDPSDPPDPQEQGEDHR